MLEEYPLGGYTKYGKIKVGWYGSQDYLSFKGVRDAVHLGATCRKMHTIIAPFILEHDKKVNFSSALLLSVKNGSMEGVIRALSHGQDINTADRTLFDIFIMDSDGYDDYSEYWRIPIFSTLTSLHWACFYGNEELVTYLLANGADFQQRADLGFQHSLETNESGDQWKSETLNWSHSRRAMMTATKEQYAAFPMYSDLEIPIGANALFFALKDSPSPIHRMKWDASTFKEDDLLVTEDESGCRLAITKLLIRAGSSLITCDATRFHALHQAAAYCDIEVARYLMDELNVDPNVRNTDDETPLHILARNRKHGPYNHTKEMIELLAERGGDTNLKGSNGLTPEEMGLSIPAV
ncbi:Serine/threonine-protein phosphatase 6 regulatory ankyrin repeat subunit A [Colletotrichum siamense]|nr:Serine/threonine-protein phosphatase 6 regulatory ankyrin repeat subunit A [Colletotrichum siamense]